MSIAFELEFPGMTKDQYMSVMRELGLDKKDAKWPDGSIEHTAGPIENGWAVFDIWESEAKWQRFRDTLLSAAFAKVGGIPQPSVKRFVVQYRHAA
jgi:hypothetical protein